ncbi:MAG TPA: helix-turn-helix domain-containing protein, partial [Acidimicrobiales bacterium]
RPERQASILRAAGTAFARTGYAATSMEDVAAEAGVTKLILYRHFESKEELYRAVLERVSSRLGDEFVTGLTEGRPGFVVRTHLDVAREDPDGYRLLWVHAAREPQFAEYVHAFHEGAAEAADDLVGRTIRDRTFRRWATHALVAMIVEAVLAWLDHGAVHRDDEFVERTTAGMRALVQALATRR